jgi:hypothetical protein
MTFQSSRYFNNVRADKAAQWHERERLSRRLQSGVQCGHVASFILIAAEVAAAEKRGAGPNSPRLYRARLERLDASGSDQQSACRLDVGSATRCSRFTPRLIKARVADIGTPETSRGTTSVQPSAIGAITSSMDFAG